MKREDSPFYRLLILVFEVMVRALGLVVAFLVLLFIYMLMNPPNKVEELASDQIISSDVYLRNRNDSVFFLTLTVPRSSLQIDTVWWGVQVAPEAVGWAVAAVAPSLILANTVYPLTGPVLLQGSGDTLVADKPIDLPATGLVGKRKLFYPHRNLPLWKERVRQFKPVFEPTMVIQPFAGQPDSVVMIVRLASDGTFLLAREEKRTMRRVELEDVNEDGRIDTLVVTAYALLPTVRWTDSLQHSHNRRVTSADIQKARATRPIRDSAEPNKLIYYLDYQ